MSILKLKGNKRSKKTEMEPEELEWYISFLDRKMYATFKDVARFYVVTTGLERTTFSKWDGTISRAKVRKNRRACIFTLNDFRGIPSASRQGAKWEPFYNPFMATFMEYKLPTMREPHVWQ